MKEKSGASKEFQLEVEELRARLLEAEAAIQAIRSGEVDAVVVNGPEGEKIYTLSGADRTYRILVDAMNEGALVLSKEGIIIYCNRTFAAMLELPMSSVLGYSIFNFVAEADILPLRSLLEQYPSGTSRKEFSLKGSGKNQVPALFSVSKLDNDERQSISAIVTDLTERKLAEEKLENYRKHLEELVVERTKDFANAELELKRYNNELKVANSELESFSYSVSHDLKAPLRALVGFSQILIEDYQHLIDEAGQDYLNRIWKASQTMSQLINDMLRLSGIIRAEMQIDRVDLSAIANSIASELADRQSDRKVKFSIASGILVTGDASLLQICLRNLFENAWKFTVRNSEAIIEFGVISSDNGRVYYVKDNGIGFDMKYSNKLFQPFQRLHFGNEYPGTGIGLAIVQRVIRRHGGLIWAESTIGKGTAFFFTIGSDEARNSSNR